MKEICICAASLTTDGIIIRGHRHSDCFYTAKRMQKKIKTQGFVTSKNRFVDRKIGAILQNNAKILSAWTGKKIKKLLFSEDLY